MRSGEREKKEGNHGESLKNEERTELHFLCPCGYIVQQAILKQGIDA